MCRIRSPLLRLLLAWLPAAPARALEEIVIQIPLLERSFTGKVSELANPETLQNGKSDLAQLDRASGGGGVARQLIALVNQPVPLSLKHIANGSVGSPLLEQAMLMSSSLGTVEGHAPDLTGETLRAVAEAGLPQQRSHHAQPDPGDSSPAGDHQSRPGQPDDEPHDQPAAAGAEPDRHQRPSPCRRTAAGARAAADDPNGVPACDPQGGTTAVASDRTPRRRQWPAGADPRWTLR